MPSVPMRAETDLRDPRKRASVLPYFLPPNSKSIFSGESRGQPIIRFPGSIYFFAGSALVDYRLQAKRGERETCPLRVLLDVSAEKL